ncbi:MAG: hypothetical protein QNJ31_02370 [Candidatus Caenarcaniphilales bacterium]|nr:hypothetical protein [Candidatus Caenarcaniphilales bacterium]
MIPNGQVFIFGSQANLPNLILADIDIGIDIGRTLTVGELSAINTSLEEIPSLYPFDLVDFANVDEKFKQAALKNTEPL